MENLKEKITLVKGRTVFLSILMIAIFVAGSVFGINKAFATEPGTKDDPIVTKSYVDDKLMYKPVKMEEGQTIIGGEGAEIILRAGEGTAIASGINGIADLTLGQDIKNGNKIKQNHLLIVPRADGRGFKADTLCWILVRGDYELK